MPTRRSVLTRTEPLAVGRTVQAAGLTLIALALLVQALVQVGELLALDDVGADFVNQTYEAGANVLSGDATWLTRGFDTIYTTAPYPPPLVIALSPLSLLPEAVAIAV